MLKFTSKRYVELFHLLLLDQLGRKLDRRFYALKGGCNLRFYFKSIRYSEDIDLDIQTIPGEKLQNTMDAILKSEPFAQILRVRGIMVDGWSKPKQTETTQRWKMSLSLEDSDVLLHTKVEFSRRGVKANTVFETMDPELINSYYLSPIMLNHYSADSAYEQKIEALILRTATQARDIFDLNLLLNSGVNTTILNSKLKDRLPEAESNSLSVTFDKFKSQVLSFLHPDYQKQYDSESIWDDMVLKVVDAIHKETS